MTLRARKIPDAEALRVRMAGLCARSEQCSSDIYAKLRKAGLADSDSREILEFLTDRKFLSDERYARAFVNDKVKFSGWGRYKIRLALTAKKIPSSLIKEAMEGIDEDEYSLALRHTAAAKAKSLDLSMREEIQKLYRHLLSRGFESDMAATETRRLAAQARKK